MWKQLKELGVSDNRIKFGAMVPPRQSGIEEEAFSHGETLVSKGKYLEYVSPGFGEKQITTIEEMQETIREFREKTNPDIGFFEQLSTKPVSRVSGSERGMAIDRYFIEEFLKKNENYIHGTVMEIADNKYTKKFGREVDKSIICHVKGWGKDSIVCNFETGEGCEENFLDCLICTQTLQYIFNLESAIKNIFKMLKAGGTALITVPGIKPLCEYENDRWGEFWSFTFNSVNRLCSLVCDTDGYCVTQYGNVKLASAYLYGLCVEELSPSDFYYNDLQYPFVICARITKNN